MKYLFILYLIFAIHFITHLNAESSCPSGSVFYDNFDPTFSSAVWEKIAGAIPSSGCGSHSGNALYFNGENKRYAITKEIPAGSYTLKFWIVIGSGTSTCEPADFGEDVVLEKISTTNTTLVTLTYNEYETPETIYLSVTSDKPFKIQLRQKAFSCGTCDNWAIDEFDLIDTTLCNVCQPGTYNSGGVCKSCDPGTYSPTGESCINCPPGTYSPSGSHMCFDCQPGYYSTGAAGSCLPCDGGYFASNPGSSMCDICPAGTFSTGASPTCKNCPGGTFSSTSGSTSCST